MNRITQIILLLVALLLPVTAAAYDFEVDGIFYNINGNEAIVTYQQYANYSYQSDYNGDVNIPESVTYNGTTYTVASIGNSAFRDCSGLTSITIPNSVISIGSSAFYGCSGLTGSLTIPNSVTSIGSYAFCDCSGLTGSLTIPNSVTSIGSYAFCDCSGLTGSLTIPNSVTSIARGSFKNCSGLTNINIPKSVETIYADAFVGCNSLQSFYVDEANTNYSSDKGVLISSSTLVMCPARKDNYCIPSTINYLSEYAFNDCMMSELTIEANSNDYLWSTATTFNRAQITSVIINRRTNASFKGMSSLEYVTLGDKAGVYVDIKFAGTGIHEVHLPYAVTICDSCFTDCEELSIIELGDNIISIGAKAFDNTAYLNNQQFESGIKYIDEYAVLYDFLSDTIRVKDGTKLLIEALCYNSPYSTPPLNEVLLPNSLQYIGDNCFLSSNLNSIILPDSLVSIGRSAFESTKLSSISIPASVMSISQYAFASISYLTSVRFEDGENILNLGKNEFESGISRGIFGQSYNIKKAYIGRVLSYDTTLGYGPFTQYGTGTNSQLTEVEIGPYVNHFESRLLYKNPNITSVKVDRNVPPTNPWFESNVYTAATLHIPDGSKSVYQEADGWKNFINIIEDSILATSITLDQSTVVINENETLQLTATVMPEDATNRMVTWNSSNEAVATVDENGLVTAVAPGSAVITAMTTDGSNLSASCNITVLQGIVLAESIQLNVTTAGLNEGATLQLSATVQPEDCDNKTVLWSSDNPSVATVDSNGLVTTHSVGTATITAMTTDGSNLNTSCTVTLLPVGVKGDVNGDNVINIADVTKLIDYLLGGSWN
jgi:uncharacterized protein YjdB